MIFAFFGYNESFAGEAGLDKFKTGPRRASSSTRWRRSTTASRPRGWCCSRPSPTRTCTTATCPTAAENNARLELYTAAMAEVAKANEVAVRRSVHADARRLIASRAEPLTINGIHLNEHGDAAASPRSSTQALFADAAATKRDAPTLEKLRQAVIDKNFYWFNRYRTTDGYSIYGGRADPEVRRRADQPRRRAARDGSARRDDRQPRQARSGPWPQGNDVKVDDSNTPAVHPRRSRTSPARCPAASTSSSTARKRSSKMTVAQGHEGQPLRLRREVPRAGQPGADGVRHQGPAVGRRLADLSALEADARR